MSDGKKTLDLLSRDELIAEIKVVRQNLYNERHTRKALQSELKEVKNTVNPHAICFDEHKQSMWLKVHASIEAISKLDESGVLVDYEEQVSEHIAQIADAMRHLCEINDIIHKYSTGSKV